MKLLVASLCSALSLLSAVAQAYPNPGSCSGTCNNAHDPSIIRRDSDGTYFRFSTGGKIAIHTASSITGPWTYKCAMLPNGSKINLAGNNDLWAPDVSKVGSTYYVYYSVSTFGSQNSAIGLATSTSMDCNSFTDVGGVGVASSSGKSYNAIDANLIAAADGSYYLTFGSFWSNIYQVKMAGPPSKTGGGSAYQLAYQPSGTHAREGAVVVYRSGLYYLFFSEGVCCGYDSSRPAKGAEYHVKVCASSSPTGGFVDKSGVACTSGGGTMVLESHDNVYGPGGQSVYLDPSNGWVMVYHYVDTTIGYADGQKKFGWNKICWSGGWPSLC